MLLGTVNLPSGYIKLTVACTIKTSQMLSPVTPVTNLIQGVIAPLCQFSAFLICLPASTSASRQNVLSSRARVMFSQIVH